MQHVQQKGDQQQRETAAAALLLAGGKRLLDAFLRGTMLIVAKRGRRDCEYAHGGE
jgi:hypothetical protein